MFGTRQSLPRARGRSILALSTLALLAFCCLPALANASGAGYQYEDAPQTATGKPPSESNLSGGSKSTSGIGSHAGSSSTDNGLKNGKSADGAGGSSAKSGGAAGGQDAADQAGGQGKGGNETQDAAGSPISSTAPGSDSGGSSPLIPILIAIVLLAGGSVAYVMIKRRRDGGEPGSDEPGAADSSGSPVSPEAS
jgi:cobalamin biosynthesis Mg chelatase CobN